MVAPAQSVANAARWPGDREGRIPFAWHSIGSLEQESVARALAADGPLVNGPLVAEFEERFAAAVGAKHAIATSSCTAALEACYLAIGVAGRPVVTSPLTFHATAEMARAAGGEVRFADVEHAGYHLSPDAAYRAAEGAAAIVPVHYAGVAADIEAIEDVAWAVGATVVEDAAAAVGAIYADASMVGSRPNNLCCFSLGVQKPLSVGYGGMVTTGDEKLAEKVRRIVLQGMVRQGSARDQVLPGRNGRMSEIEAAIGLAQLARLERLIHERRTLEESYRRHLASVDGVELPPWEPCLETGNSAQFPIRAMRRARLIEELAAAGIETAIHYRPVHTLSAWAGHGMAGRGSFPAAEVAGEWTLSLPLFPGMDEADVARVTAIVRRVHEA